MHELGRVCELLAGAAPRGPGGDRRHQRRNRPRDAGDGPAPAADGRWVRCRPPVRSARASCTAIYDELLRERGVTSAQVLLTFFDMSARTHYLNARQTLRTLLEWRVMPVINENDTAATDEISFGDNDFLAAQVAVSIGRRQADRADRHRWALHRRSAPVPGGAHRRARSTDFAALQALEIGHTTSPLGSGGMRSKVVAAEMATAAGIATAICNGLASRRLRRRSPANAPAPLPGPRGPLQQLQAVAEVRQALARHARRSMPARCAPCARAAPACCPSASSRCSATSTPATRSRSGSTATAERAADARQGHLQLLRRRAAACERPEVGVRARDPPARDRRGRASRLPRPRLRRSQPCSEPWRERTVSVACLDRRRGVRGRPSAPRAHSPSTTTRSRTPRWTRSRRRSGARARRSRRQRQRHAAAREAGLGEALLDRLRLDQERVGGIAARRAPDRRAPEPVGEVIDG